MTSVCRRFVQATNRQIQALSSDRPEMLNLRGCAQVNSRGLAAKKGPDDGWGFSSTEPAEGKMYIYGEHCVFSLSAGTLLSSALSM